MRRGFFSSLGIAAKGWSNFSVSWKLFCLDRLQQGMHWISAVLTAWQWHKVVYGHSKCILCGNAVKWICSSVANRAPILQTSPAMTAVHLNASTYLHELFTKDNGFEPVKWQECFKSGNKIKSQWSLLRHLHQEPHFSVRNCLNYSLYLHKIFSPLFHPHYYHE